MTEVESATARLKAERSTELSYTNGRNSQNRARDPAAWSDTLTTQATLTLHHLKG